MLVETAPVTLPTQSGKTNDSITHTTTQQLTVKNKVIKLILTMQ